MPLLHRKSPAIGAILGLGCTSLLLPMGCSSSSHSGARDGGAHTDSGTKPDAGKGSGKTDSGKGHDGGKTIPVDGFAWAESFQAGDGSDIYAMASDGSSVVLAGQIVGSATFGSTKLTAEDITGNAFVAKLDTSGHVVWAQIATGNHSDFEAVAIDASGNVILGGQDFGDGAGFTFGGSTLSPNRGMLINGKTPSSEGGVLLLMNGSGNVMWSKYVDTTGEANMSSVAVTSSAIYVAGAIIDDADFSNGAGPVVAGCGTKGCVFLATFDTSGNIQTAVIPQSTPHRGTGVDPREVWVAASGSSLTMAVGGYYSSAGGETNDTQKLVVNQYDLSGSLVWTKTFADSAGSPTVNGLVLDSDGNAYVAGDEANGLTIDTLKVKNAQYLAKLSSSGSVTWAVENVGLEVLGIQGLALGPHVYTFGNGDLRQGSSPAGGTSMSLDVFDPKTGTIVANGPCSASNGLGLQATASSAGVFVSGTGGPTGTFGTHKLTEAGFFVAKLQE